MKHVDQSYKDLSYQFYEKDFNLVNYKVLENRVFPIDDLIVEAFILGESHALKFTINDETYTEVLSCSTLPVDEHLVTEVNEFSIDLQNYRYHFRRETFPMIIKFNQSETSLSQQFPDNSWTSIFVNTLIDGCVVETYHTYPNENTTVRSLTTFRKVFTP